MRVLLVLLSLSVLGLGCAAHVPTAQTRFARDYGCPVEQTTYQFLGDGHYHVSGCDKQAEYTCMTEGQMVTETTCIRESGPATP